MCDNNVRGPSILEISLAARQFEIELFWRRSLFFWGFIAAAFVGVASLYGTHPRLSLVVSCFGTVCAICWSLVNRGSKYWYETWEKKVKDAGGSAINALFSETPAAIDRGPWSARRFSVSRVAIALSDFTSALWIGVLVYQTYSWMTTASMSSWRDVAVVLLIAFTVLYIPWVFFETQDHSSSCAQKRETNPSPNNGGASSDSGLGNKGRDEAE